MSSTEIGRCLVCDSRALIPYMNLGDQPLANSFSSEAGKIQEKYPLMVNFCHSCSHNQLSHRVDPEILFKDYLYVSGTSKTLSDHFDSYADYIFNRFGTTGIRVLEIASNDGSLLEKFSKRGATVLGVDPAENLKPISESKGIPTIADFWPCPVDGKFDVVIANNVLAHHPDPVGFLSSLPPEALVCVEFPIFNSSVETLDIGQIYAEHISYFNHNSFSILAQRAGYGIVDFIEFPDIHGGTVRFILEKGAKQCEKMTNMIKVERVQGFHDIAKYQLFYDKVAVNLLGLVTCCNIQTTINYKIVGYGAAAKASTILSTLADSLPVDFFVDDSPHKVGKFMPGTSREIFPTSKLGEVEGPMAIIVFAHNFKKEIKENIKKYRQPSQKDIIINIVPKVTVEDLYEATAETH